MKLNVINREKVSGNFYDYINLHGEDSLMRNVNLVSYPFRKLDFEGCNKLIIPRKTHSDSDCKEAMKVELEKLKQFDSYENVNDEGQYKILSRGVYWCKGDEVKAQLVAKLFEEKKEVPSDFPTVDKCSIRQLLIICEADTDNMVLSVESSSPSPLTLQLRLWISCQE